MMEAHVRGMLGLYGERIGMRNARKVILAYMKGRGFHSERRRSVSCLSTLDEFARFVTALRSEGPSPRYNPGQTRRATTFARPDRGLCGVGAAGAPAGMDAGQSACCHARSVMG